MSLSPFVEAKPVPREVKQARWVFAVLAAQFIVPAFSYLVQPAVALGTLDRVNRLLGGGGYAAAENTGHVWHMLAVGNVMTLGFLCALLAFDVRRFYPALPGLVFLKGFSALFSLGLGLTGHPPLFFAVFALDGATTVAMVVFGVRANRALRRAEGEVLAPWWAWFLLWEPEQVMAGLERVRRARPLEPSPTLPQVWRGVMRMWGRVMFRSETVGTSGNPVRAGWRARLLRFRAVRLPFLLAGRVVAPLDFSGLVSSPERIIRHLLGAHHQRHQLVYDLELLELHPGMLEALERAARDVVEHDTRRTRWLRDLCAFEGYHEELLDAVVRYRCGEALLPVERAMDPDLTLRGFLAWCAAQPDSSSSGRRWPREGEVS